MAKEKKKRWSSCPVEEHYLGDFRKEEKGERKKKQAQDRSKYKKTDLAKRKKAQNSDDEISGDLVEGQVIRIGSEGYVVSDKKQEFICFLRGILKKEQHEDKNLVTVGDRVHFTPIEGQEGVISKVLPRKSELVRQDNITRKKRQLIASNIDQVLITVSVVSPLLKPPIIDRYIISALKGNMDPILVINKIDLLDGEGEEVEIEREIYKETLKAYKLAKIPTISISAETQKGIPALKKIMKNKVSVFAGQSGVGKSSLINATTQSDLEVRDVVARTKKGSHTTTQAKLLPLPFKGWCIDTPGIKSFGIWELKKEEIGSYFSEIDHFAAQCHFSDCTHTHEGGCEVLKALEEEGISGIRYDSYLSLLNEMEEKYRRR